MKEDIERRRMEAAERMKSLSTSGVDGDETFSPFGPKTPTHKVNHTCGSGASTKCIWKQFQSHLWMFSSVEKANDLFSLHWFLSANPKKCQRLVVHQFSDRLTKSWCNVIQGSWTLAVLLGSYVFGLSTLITWLF